MANKSFSASVRAFAGKTAMQMRDVFAESVQDVMDTAQLPKEKGGRMPVVSSQLRNSVASGLNGSFGPTGPVSYVVTLSEMELGDVARFAWTAPYARRIEAGFTGTDSLGRFYAQAGQHFVGAAAAQFPQFVAMNVARIKT